MAPAPAVKTAGGCAVGALRLGAITSLNPESLIRSCRSSFLSSAEPVAGAMRARRPAVATMVLTLLFIPFASFKRSLDGNMLATSAAPAHPPLSPDRQDATHNAVNVERNDGRSRAVPRARLS